MRFFLVETSFCFVFQSSASGYLVAHHVGTPFHRNLPEHGSGVQAALSHDLFSPNTLAGQQLKLGELGIGWAAFCARCGERCR